MLLLIWVERKFIADDNWPNTVLIWRERDRDYCENIILFVYCDHPCTIMCSPSHHNDCCDRYAQVDHWQTDNVCELLRSYWYFSICELILSVECWVVSSYNRMFQNEATVRPTSLWRFPTTEPRRHSPVHFLLLCPVTLHSCTDSFLFTTWTVLILKLPSDS